MNQRLLVISGGGSRGAWGGGVAESLFDEGKTYTKAIGTSTGSLMGVLVLLKAFDRLKKGYTTVTQKDIFNVNPFVTSGPKKGQIRVLNAIWRVLFYHTLGETLPLRERIKSFVTKTDYEQIRANKQEFLATVTNMTNFQVAYQSTDDYSYEEMVDWIWASANEPFVMSEFFTTDKNGLKNYWVDGGLRQIIPVQKGIEIALNHGINNIDVIVHSTENPPEFDSEWQSTGVLQSLLRTIKIMTRSIRESNIEVGILLEKLANMERDDAIKKGDSAEGLPFILNIYYMKTDDYKDTYNNLIFEEDTMLRLWEHGKNKHYEVRTYQLSESSLRKIAQF